jgi:ATP-dependent RNA helicase SUPV3L1/SUV3
MPTKSPTPNPLNLPQPRHTDRVPVHIGKEQVARIKQLAYALPQVTKATDHGYTADAAGDEKLDALGLVMLQKAAASARASRWITPQLMDSALAHIEAVGSGPEARPLMLQRSSALEALGVARAAGAAGTVLWTRLISHGLMLAGVNTKIAVQYRVPVAAEPVWAYYRDADSAALLTALGAPPPCPFAAELTAHLEALVARSRSFRPQQLDSLLPRLQAECASAKPLLSLQASEGNQRALADLQASCNRAQERWVQAATELDTLQGLNHELAFQGYPATFAKARRLNRRVTLYVGPPNSGKTHAAFERLAQALDGAYLAPLRLLALEGRDRLVARGVPCSLLTGEENQPADGARVVSSTIEMVNTQKTIDVAVIDEAQMIFDSSRGWAWTQAVVAVPAQEVIIICSAYAVPALQNLLGLCGEACTVREFTRIQHVQLLPGTLPVHALKMGDAVVAFSRRDVLALRDSIAANGHPVSVIYGALPPEVRRREAERFATGESHILVATDAIGMGLNLPIRRVLFSTLTKYDGVADRSLEETEVHQIAGRAGRFGLHEEGFVGVLDDAEPGAPRMLKERLAQQPRAPRNFKAPVAPNGWHVDTIAARLSKNKLRDVLAVFMEQLKLDDAHFAVAELEQMLALAEQLDSVAGKLTLKERFTYAQAPVDMRTDTLVQDYLGWAARHAATGKAGRPEFLDHVDGHSRLERMEQALRGCTLWLWLGLRFPGVYGHEETVYTLRGVLNDGIERQLKGKRPLAQLRRGGAGGGRLGGKGEGRPDGTTGPGAARRVPRRR